MPFVVSQSQALETFEPYFVGIRLVSNGGMPISADRILTINGKSGMIGKIREVPFRRFGFAPLYLRRLKRLDPVLLHAHSGFAGLSALKLAALLRIPLATTFHGRDATIDDLLAVDSRYSMRDYIHRRHILARKGQIFIAVSHFMKRKMIDLGIPEKKIVVHYTGVDTDFFCPNPDSVGEPIVLFVGRLDEMKGCEYAIRAMAKVQSRLPEVELVVIGDGPLRPSLERMAEKELRRYRFLGPQSAEAVRDWMNRSRVFAVPSVTAMTGETETFGMVFAEAQAMGVPVASFSSGGIPEAVAHGETGLLAKEKDWTALADNIEKLFRDEELWRRLSEAGRKRVRSLFNLKIQTVILEDLYRHVIYSRGSTS